MVTRPMVTPPTILLGNTLEFQPFGFSSWNPVADGYQAYRLQSPRFQLFCLFSINVLDTVHADSLSASLQVSLSVSRILLDHRMTIFSCKFDFLLSVFHFEIGDFLYLVI